MGELPASRRALAGAIATAILLAGIILTVAVLPAEYGIDPTGIGRLLGLQAMGEIKKSAAATTATTTGTAPVASGASVVAVAPGVAPAFANAPPAASTAGVRKDQVSVTLKPGEGAEMKLVMDQGALVRYRWATRDGAVNFDAHGEASENSFAVSYKKGKDARQDEGTLEAAFKGQHGWYWKNRSRQPVTVDLSTEGQYSEIKRVL